MAVSFEGSGGGGDVGVPLTVGGCARMGGLVVTGDCVDEGGEVLIVLRSALADVDFVDLTDARRWL